MKKFSRPVACLMLAVAALGTSACAPLLLGGAMVTGTVAATDRRTVGIQVEDKGISLKALNRLGDPLGERAHINVTAYNRRVLLTGEVPNAATRQEAERIVSGIENVKGVINELEIAGASSVTARSNDALITTKVKGTLLDTRNLYSRAFKVVTESGKVYLLGRVTEREGNQAAEAARGVSGVQKVVKVFEYISEDELRRLSTMKAPVTAPDPDDNPVN